MSGEHHSCYHLRCRETHFRRHQMIVCWLSCDVVHNQETK
jgi:hypothetical protein